MKSIFKLAEEDPNFKALFNIEFTDEKSYKGEKKMKTFGVFHIFDTDGGFGDAIEKKELVCTFNSEEEANEFKTKYEKPHVYDCPYQCLECGKLEVEELPTSYNEKDFWWLYNEDYNVDEDEE